MQSKVDFIDFTGATGDDVKLLAPYAIGSVYTLAKNDRERAIERGEQLKTPFEENITKLFDFIKADSEGKRLVTSIQETPSFDGNKDDFDYMLRIYKHLNENTVGGGFFSEARKDIPMLYNQFMEDVQAESPITEEEAAVKFGESGGNPDDIVAIVGETKKWMGTIKSTANNKGGGKFKWDKRAGAWNVRRSTWDALVETYTAVSRELKIIPATIARF